MAQTESAAMNCINILMHCVPTYGYVCTQLSISVLMSQLLMIIKVHSVF